MKNSRNGSPVVAALVALVLAACTGSPPDAGEVTGRPTGGGTSGSPTTGTVSIPKVPEGDPDRRSLAEVPARRGSWTVGAVDVMPGELVLLSDCTGGTLTLHVDPVATVPISCAANEVTPAQNVIVLKQAKHVTIRVEAPDSVLWNLRVEQ
jgi:hypothetical protein